MRIITLIAVGLFFIGAAHVKTVHDFTVKDIDGKDVSLNQYKGKVLLIVNVASLCGNTPQYKDIEALYEKYQGMGLVVLGFPANNFMGQEPGTDSEIKSFCTKNYDVKFPMFSKISVKGDKIDPLYSYLTQKSENGVIDAPVTWNFQKFLVNKDGMVVASFDPRKKVTEQEVISAIEEALKK